MDMLDNVSMAFQEAPGTSAEIKAVCRYLSVRQMLTWFVLVNLVCIVVFWVWRWVLLLVDPGNFIITEAELEHDFAPFLTAGYASIMTQTTVGTAELAPVTTHAKFLTGLQALSALGSVIVIAMLVSTQSKRMAAHSMSA